MDSNEPINEAMIKEMLQNIQNLDQIPSDLMARAKKLTNTRAGREMIKEMSNKGINKEMVEKLMKEEKQTVNVLVIRANGIVKSRQIVINDDYPTILHATLPTKYIKNNYSIWYDANIKTINKKATKWLGFNVGGMIVIIGDDLDKIKF